MQIRGPLSVENSLEDLGVNDELWDESGYQIASIPRDERERSCVIMTAAAKHPALSRIQQQAEDRQILGSRLAPWARTYFAVPKEIKFPMLSELREAIGSSNSTHESSIRCKMSSRGSRFGRLPRVLTCYLAIVRT